MDKIRKRLLLELGRGIIESIAHESEKRAGFLSICLDLVIHNMSPDEMLSRIKDKIAEEGLPAFPEKEEKLMRDLYDLLDRYCKKEPVVGSDEYLDELLKSLKNEE